MPKAVLVWIALLILSPLKAAGIYNAKSFDMPNGLKVYVMENKRTPVVGFYVGYKVGGADDPLGKSGLAHYLEHMMFKGPDGSASRKLMPFVESVGGISNAMTSDDMTIYYEIVPKNHIEEIVRMEAERMHNLQIIPEQAIPEIQVILEEKNMRIGNNPFGHFFMELQAVFYNHHPYRLPVIGWTHEIKSYTPDDVINLHKKNYAPNNAIMIFSGDISLDQAKALITKYFTKIPEISLSPRTRVQDAPLTAKLRVDYDSDLINVPSIVMMYPAPNYSKANLKKVLALMVLADVLAGSDNSVLYSNLVEKSKLASAVNADYEPASIDPKAFSIMATASIGQPIEQLEKRMHEELDKLKKEGFSIRAINQSKKRMLSGLPLMRDSLLSGADSLIHDLLVGIPLDILEHFDDHIKNVTPTEVNEVFKEVLGNPHYLTGIMRPSGKTPLSPSAAQPSLKINGAIQ